MADILKQSKKLFGTKDLYKIFDVVKNANSAQLKKAYYKVSLKVHPDKIDAGDDKARATEKFQLISKLYKILSDEKKRKIYDKTGEIDEDDFLGMSDDTLWLDYWRTLFPEITVDQINDFHSKYKGSDEELSSLKEAYMSAKGNIQKIIDSMMCATVDDEARFRELLEPFIKSKELPIYKIFSNETAGSKKKRLAKASNEAKEAEKHGKDLSKGSSSEYSDLVLAMQRNQEKRKGILSYLEEKYCNDNDDDVAFETKSSKKKTKTDSKRKSGSLADASGSKGKRQKKA